MYGDKVMDHIVSCLIEIMYDCTTQRFLNLCFMKLFNQASEHENAFGCHVAGSLNFIKYRLRNLSQTK